MKFRPCLLFVLLNLPLLSDAAQPVFVTDRIEVQLRAGRSPQHKVLKMLTSGTPLTALEADNHTGYMHVKLDTGEEGWVLTRYLSSQPSARVQVEKLTEENKTLKTQLEQSRAGNGGADIPPTEQGAEIERLNGELVAIRQASADVLQIQKARDELQEKVIQLEQKIASLDRENSTLDYSEKQDWFLTGAGVLTGGIVLGLLLPRLSWRKRDSWNTF